MTHEAIDQATQILESLNEFDPAADKLTAFLNILAEETEGVDPMSILLRGKIEELQGFIKSAEALGGDQGRNIRIEVLQQMGRVLNDMQIVQEQRLIAEHFRNGGWLAPVANA